jgi:hypothetical protein
MTARRTTTKALKRIPPPPQPEEGYDALIAYLHKYPLEDLEKAGYLQEPTPQEMQALDADMIHHVARQQVKGLAKEYPKTRRERTARLAALLKCVPGLKLTERRAIASALNIIADKAHDLDAIVDRLLHQEHTPAEIGELLLAFQEVTEYVRSYDENLMGRLYEIFDRVKGLTPTNDAPR